MKTKTNIYLVVIIVFAGILAGIWTFVRLKPDISELTNLKLDQGNAYISISSNDVSGYNRWLPFYFQVEGNNNLSERDVEAALKEKISRALLTQRCESCSAIYTKNPSVSPLTPNTQGQISDLPSPKKLLKRRKGWGCSIRLNLTTEMLPAVLGSVIRQGCSPRYLLCFTSISAVTEDFFIIQIRATPPLFSLMRRQSDALSLCGVDRGGVDRLSVSAYIRYAVDAFVRLA